jgi:hypothetical protein
MELPLLNQKRFNVKVIHSVKDASTNQSFNKLDKSEKFMQMYRLGGNESLNHMQRYKDLMSKYSKKFSKDRLVRKVRKEIQSRHLFKDFSLQSPSSPSRLQTYRLIYSPDLRNSKS